MTVISWNTSKVANGFQYRVYSFGYETPAVELKTGVVATRAQATLRAKRWMMFFKNQAKKEG